MGAYTNSQNAAICIGRGVPAGNCVIDNLFVTPTGEIVIVEAVPHDGADYAAALQEWRASDLDRVAEQYSFGLYGQAFRVIDLMAKEGLLTFQDGRALMEKLDLTLSDGACLVLLADGPAVRSPGGCPSRRDLIYRFAAHSGVTPDDVVELLQEIEAVPGYSVLTTPTELRVDFSDGEQRISALRLRVSDAAVFVDNGALLAPILQKLARVIKL